MDNVDRFAAVLAAVWVLTGMRYDWLLYLSAAVVVVNFIPTLCLIFAFWGRR